VSVQIFCSEIKLSETKEKKGQGFYMPINPTANMAEKSRPDHYGLRKYYLPGVKKRVAVVWNLHIRVHN
jgi:hypothetical protein